MGGEKKIKEDGRYIVVDNLNAYYDYQNLETAKLSFAARCSYLEKTKKGENNEKENT